MGLGWDGTYLFLFLYDDGGDIDQTVVDINLHSLNECERVFSVLSMFDVSVSRATASHSILISVTGSVHKNDIERAPSCLHRTDLLQDDKSG